jgi:hypothetical protein
MDTTKKVDMYYRFTWDTEPTDEQLNAIMEEVKIDVIKQSKKNKIMLQKQIEEEFLETKSE